MTLFLLIFYIVVCFLCVLSFRAFLNRPEIFVWVRTWALMLCTLWCCEFCYSMSSDALWARKFYELWCSVRSHDAPELRSPTSCDACLAIEQRIKCSHVVHLFTLHFCFFQRREHNVWTRSSRLSCCDVPRNKLVAKQESHWYYFVIFFYNTFITKIWDVLNLKMYLLKCSHVFSDILSDIYLFTDWSSLISFCLNDFIGTHAHTSLCIIIIESIFLIASCCPTNSCCC